MMTPMQFLNHIAQNAQTRYRDMLWGIRDFYSKRGYLTERQAIAVQTTARHLGLSCPDGLVIEGQPQPRPQARTRPSPPSEDEVPWPLDMDLWDAVWRHTHPE